MPLKQKGVAGDMKPSHPHEKNITKAEFLNHPCSKIREHCNRAYTIWNKVIGPLKEWQHVMLKDSKEGWKLSLVLDIMNTYFKIVYEGSLNEINRVSTDILFQRLARFLPRPVYEQIKNEITHNQLEFDKRGNTLAQNCIKAQPFAPTNPLALDLKELAIEPETIWKILEDVTDIIGFELNTVLLAYKQLIELKDSMLTTKHVEDIKKANIMIFTMNIEVKKLIKLALQCNKPIVYVLPKSDEISELWKTWSKLKDLVNSN